jgi:hypothetical protein
MTHTLIRLLTEYLVRQWQITHAMREIGITEGHPVGVTNIDRNAWMYHQIGGGGTALGYLTITEVIVGTGTTTTTTQMRVIDHEAVPPQDHGIGGRQSPDIGRNRTLLSLGSLTLRF